MNPFQYTSLPTRVIFGHGTRSRLAEELRTLGITRALVLTTPGQVALGEQIASDLNGLVVGGFNQAAMHTPVEVTARALEVVQHLGADGLIAVGGGSTIGLAKAIALHTDLPQIALPTTYAGSEMTSILGQTEHGLKTTQRSLKVLPELVIYDVELTFGLPARVSATSGMNAMAHAIEALYAPDANPITSMMAEEGIRALTSSLPKVVAQLQDLEARSDALYGAWLSAVCLAHVGMGLHHKLCHTLGGTFNLPHAETHTILLPHATAYNAPFAPEAMARAARALNTNDPARALYDLAGGLGAPLALRDLGMPEDGIERAADLAVKSPYPNPRPLERQAIRDLLTRAWAGQPPQT